MLRRSWFAAIAAAFAAGRTARAQSLVQITSFSPARDVFTVPALTQTLSAPPTPNLPVDVYLNGLLMAEGLDYTLAWRTVTFLSQPAAAASGAIVQVRYWRA